MVLPSKLTIFVTFQFAEKPLAYLRSICREFPSQGDQVKDYLFTNAVQKHATIEDAIQCPGLEIEILSPTLSGHP